MRGYGYAVHEVSGPHQGETAAEVHRRLARVLDTCLDEIAEIQSSRHGAGQEPAIRTAPRWPMVVLRTPKGWTGPAEVDGHRVEGTWRSHQVPLGGVRTDPEHLHALEEWLASYRPHELFDSGGRPVDEVAGQAPSGRARMSANPRTNGGKVLVPLTLPDPRDYAVDVLSPGTGTSSPTGVLGGLLRDAIAANPDTFRLFGPDEVASNKLQAVFETTGRVWAQEITGDDDHLAPDGRVMEVLSEQLCQGWLEGYLLTGRHGLFTSYEAFIRIVDSMLNQHAKWLKVSRQLPWRAPLASLNYLLSSHVWRQDHNGFSHQDPGFIDHVVDKKAEVVRVYLPPDANSLLVTMDHCLRSRHYVNVVVAGKQENLDYLTLEEAIEHGSRGLGVWDWASTDGGGQPDVVLACAGDVLTLEALAAADLLRQHLPDLRVRLVNVVDLMRLQSDTEHPHGLSDDDFDDLFTRDLPVIFAWHGYPSLIHRLTYRRTNHVNIHVRGYKEEGTTTTPFDMVMLNDLDRFGLVMDVIDRVSGLAATAAGVRQHMVDARDAARRYTRDHGEDDPAISGWSWPHGSGASEP